MEKKTKGRQKVELKKIENEDARQVSFSKRRSGLFKKASELSTLCGAELAIVAYSPAGRPFTFGQPGVDAVCDRFLGGSSGSGHNPDPNPSLRDLHRNANIHNLNKQCMELTEILEKQRCRKEVLDQRLHALSHGPRGALLKGREGVQSLKLEELQEMARKLEDLRMKVAARASQVPHLAADPSSAPLTVDPLQMVNPAGNEPMKNSKGKGAMDNVPDWLLGGSDPRSE